MSVREVWLWNEWGHFWPLWGEEGPLDADDLDLSAELDASLRDWHAQWEFLWSRDPAWRWEQSDAFAQWEAEGDQLLLRLVGEMVGRATVVRAFRFPEDEPGLRRRGVGSD